MTEKKVRVTLARLDVQSCVRRLNALTASLGLEESYHEQQVADLELKIRAEETRYQRERAKIHTEIEEAKIDLDREKARLSLAEADEARGFDT